MKMTTPASLGFGIKVGDLGSQYGLLCEYQRIISYQQYVCGIFRRDIIDGAHMILIGASPRLLSRKRLMMSPSPCQVIISTIA